MGVVVMLKEAPLDTRQNVSKIYLNQSEKIIDHKISFVSIKQIYVHTKQMLY